MNLFLTIKLNVKSVKLLIGILERGGRKGMGRRTGDGERREEKEEREGRGRGEEERRIGERQGEKAKRGEG